MTGVKPSWIARLMQSAAGVRRQASSRNRPCLGNVSPSSPIRARARTTATAGPWPTWTRPTVGITRSKRPVRVLPIPTSITAIPRPEPTRLQLPNRKLRPLAGACGGHRASAKQPLYQSDSSRLAARVRLTAASPPPTKMCPCPGRPLGGSGSMRCSHRATADRYSISYDCRPPDVQSSTN